MKKNAILLQSVLLLSFASSALQSAEIKLSPSSNLEGLSKQITELRKSNEREDIRVSFSQGEYFAPEGIRLKSIRNAKTVLAATPGSKFYGGVKTTGWERGVVNNREAWFARLPASHANTPPELFVCNGKKMERARWPDFNPDLPYSDGWAYVAGTPVGMHSPCPGASRKTFRIKPLDRREWHKPEEGLICIFPQFNWINEIQKIKSYDIATGLMESAHPFRYELRPGNRYCIIGMKEELDSPGEWYADMDERKLWFIPPKGTNPNDALCILPTPTPAICIEDCENITVEGFDISASECGISVKASEGITIEGCKVHDIGFFYGSGIVAKNAKNCTVKDSDVWNVGKHGIAIEGGNETVVAKSDNKVENCYIHHCGQIDRHGIGVIVSGQGTTVSNCLIHDTPRCAIVHRGRLHTIEYNVIRHTNLEMEDTGAIYGGGWTSGAGTKIAFNRISDTIGFAERNGKYRFNFFASGIHLDEAIGGVEVYGNLIERSNLAALNLHNARYVTISNNFFISNAGKEGFFWQLQFEGWNSATNGYFVKTRQKAISKEWRKLVGAQSDWKKFPSLAHSPDEPFLPDGNVMRGIKVVKNVFHYPDQPLSLYARLRDYSPDANYFSENIVNCATNARVKILKKKSFSWSEWTSMGMDSGSVENEDVFVDSENGDWRLEESSSARKLGIFDLPLDKMGLKPTKWRSGSFREAEGVREHPEWLRLPPEPVKINVSPGDGDTLDFATALERIERTRRNDKRSPIELLLPEGEYIVAEEIKISDKHARSDWGRLTVKPANGGKVRLSGGHEVKKWTKTELNNIDGVWCSDVSGLKLKKPIQSLFFNSKALENSRYPNADPTNRISGGWAYVAGERSGNMYNDNNTKNSFAVKEEDWRNWSKPEEGGVLIIPRYNWFTFTPRITKADNGKRILHLQYDLWYSPWGKDRYYAWGHKEDLDANGEWYHDLEANRIYLIAPNREDPNEHRITIPLSRGVFRFENAANATIENLEISAAANGITGRNCERITVLHCNIHDIDGFSGNGIDFLESRYCTVRGCEIENTGKQGILLGGGNPSSLERGGNVVVANKVTRTGRVDRHSCGIILNGQGNRVAANEVNEVPRIGVCPHGRMHIVERNKITDSNLESEDCGAIYLGGYASPGTVVKGNWIARSKGFGCKNGEWITPYFARGIHLDEGVGDVEVTGNIVEESAQGALCLHSARYATISNNVFLSNATQGGGAPQIDFHGWTDAANGLWKKSRMKDAVKGRAKLLDACSGWKRFKSLEKDPALPLEGGHVMHGVVVTDNKFYFADQKSSPLMWSVNFKTNENSNVFARNAVLDKKPDLTQHPAYNAGLPKEPK